MALAWAATQARAGTLARLAETFLATSDAAKIDRLLRAGRHGQAAQHFCEHFSERCFPLEYSWTGDGTGRLLVEVVSGIVHEGYGENWEEYADLWSLKPVFLLSWSLVEDPYGPPRDEFLQDEVPHEEEASFDRLCDEARAAIAQFAEVPAEELFAGVPLEGVPVHQLRPRLEGTRWEPLLWAAPWLWRVSGNRFLDQSTQEFADPEPWTWSTVFRLMGEYREAQRLTRAIDAFDRWLCEAPADRARGAAAAALGPPSERVSTLLDLPILHAV
jgi:hypothetical protein